MVSDPPFRPDAFFLPAEKRHFPNGQIFSLKQLQYMNGAISVSRRYPGPFELFIRPLGRSPRKIKISSFWVQSQSGTFFQIKPSKDHFNFGTGVDGPVGNFFKNPFHFLNALSYPNYILEEPQNSIPA